MCTSTALLSTSSPQPYRRSSICARDRIVPGRSSSSCEQRELARRERHFHPVAGHAVRGRIEPQAEVLNARGAASGLAAQQRADARRELVEIEGLDEVVVGARIEPGHPVGDRIARGDDEHRQRRARARAAT